MMVELVLKWGTLKGWDFTDCPEAMAALKEYCEHPTAYGAAQRRDTPEQKTAICKMIDAVSKAGGTIENGWDDTTMTAEQAKDYVMNYGKKAT